jgi:hypothetical protein
MKSTIALINLYSKLGRYRESAILLEMALIDCKQIDSHQHLMAQLYELKSALLHSRSPNQHLENPLVVDCLKHAIKHYRKAKLFWSELDTLYMLAYYRA